MTDRTTLKTYFENGDYPDEIQFAELIDSLMHFEDYKTVQLSANTDEGVLLLHYKGPTAPTFTRQGDGQYRIDVPTSVAPIGLELSSTPESTLTSGGQLQLTVLSADGFDFKISAPAVRQQADGLLVGATLSVNNYQTVPTPGEVLNVFTNIGGASGGYVVTANFVRHHANATNP